MPGDISYAEFTCPSSSQIAKTLVRVFAIMIVSYIECWHMGHSQVVLWFVIRGLSTRHQMKPSCAHPCHEICWALAPLHPPLIHFHLHRSLQPAAPSASGEPEAAKLFSYNCRCLKHSAATSCSARFRSTASSGGCGSESWPAVFSER